ncbi:HAD family hydrolase [Microbacterium capsulatum]|uniref:HAD family hydrolase n=1 Tax=Microbacterium capsulatum TaxID=3041921 RepID=A0ABU0XGD6_9MICO|nr:HAD family hydrolase [Microbacterium sp. ASV81]MDQ4213724.1 HAD family hydrolase [Microbacterium sp. ASV81]
MIVSDVDGTLTRSDGIISESTIEAIDRVTNDGCLFVIATARPFDDAMPIATSFRSTSAIVCQNGALTYNPHGSRNWVRMSLPVELSREIVSRVREAAPGASIALDYFDQRYASPGWRLSDPSWSGPWRKGANSHRLSIFQLEAAHMPSLTCMCILVTGAATADLKHLEAELPITVTSSASGLIEISARRATKGNAVKKLLRSMELRNVSVVAFGDMDNDVDLLRDATVGVAIGRESSALAGVADIVAPSSDEDGVAWTLNEMQAADRENPWRFVAPSDSEG